jgi:hypothetical protein
MMDGSPILRPCVLVAAALSGDAYAGVVDSGSPITVADPAFVAEAGVDLATAEPVMEVPLGMGASFGRVPMFEMRVTLLSPHSVYDETVSWSLLVAARDHWHLPFAILLGQRGWFDRFPTTIDATHTTVHLPG